MSEIRFNYNPEIEVYWRAVFREAEIDETLSFAAALRVYLHKIAQLPLPHRGGHAAARKAIAAINKKRAKKARKKGKSK